MNRIVGIAVAATLGVLAAPAAAGDVVTVETTASAPEGDDARTRALDRAFATAVREATAAMVGDDEAIARSRRAIRDHVLRRARLFVASYKILDEQSVEGRLQLRVAVRVKRDALRERLAELGVGERERPGASAAPRPKILLVVESMVDGVGQRNYGLEGEDDIAAASAVIAELSGAGFEIASGAGRQAPIGGEAGEAMPLSDEAARVLARDVGAGAVLVLGLEVVRDGRIRGTQQVGAAGRARARLLDLAEESVVAKVDIRGGGFADDAAAAVARAVADVAARAARTIAPEAVVRWPAPVAGGDERIVRVTGFRTWDGVVAVLEQIAATSGVRRAWPRRITRGRVDIAVDTDLDTGRLAATVRATRLDSGRVVAKRSGDDRVYADVRESGPEVEREDGR